MLQPGERLNRVPVSQRGWEWRHLKQLTQGGLLTLPAGITPETRDAEVTAVAMSADGARIVTGFRFMSFKNGGGALVWDARTLDRWLTDPEQLVPGQRMGYSVSEAADRADLIAYLREQSAR